MCVDKTSLSSPLHSVVTRQDQSSSLSFEHLFLGYKPLVLAFNDERRVLGEGALCLHLCRADFQLNSAWRKFPSDSHAVARMILAPVTHRFKSAQKLTLFTGSFGQHTFLNRTHQNVNKLKERFARNQAGNVNLPGNLYDMVRIAYAKPRTIALVTVADNERINLFPTDLHGQINQRLYISSLRIGGKAQQQVEKTGRIVLSEVDVDSYRDVYALGKNHMKDMSIKGSFNLSDCVSAYYGLPLPRNTLHYFELNVLEYFDIGIHRLYLYKIDNEVQLQQGRTLAHIHQYYAQWRQAQGLETNYFLR